MAAFVLGNGVSRESVSIDRLLEIGAVYACNGVYRTHAVTALVATDQPISQAIQESGYGLKNRFYTRRPVPGSGAQKIEGKYFGFSSGPIAMSIAAADGHKKIYLLGFDMGPSTDGKFNNVYASTEFYKDHGSHPTYTGNWVRQICKIASDYSNCSFIRVYGQTTAEIQELSNVFNIKRLGLETFLDRINTGKDL